ncbi:adenylate kinase 8 isoform x2 [Limosa lapponica baueri]|uniref:Adenylate kinase 8 isoform x2 n=1 Tax=Limosa lapponica baueri TaxID=1758121 RepID=A0A2I0TUW1_LIMLA|nr:adenylate kinase 8 isoform x2 [Limosa lapponica baueri]
MRSPFGNDLEHLLFSGFLKSGEESDGFERKLLELRRPVKSSSQFLISVCLLEVYHTTFDWPTDLLVQQRLVEPEDLSEQEISKKLLEYHRNFPGVFQIYQKVLKSINADQPSVDVLSQVLTYVQTRHRSAAPFTPRILFCGPPGSGKSLQAALIAQKYGVVNIPDNLVMKILAKRLNALDCVTNGWVLYGFPRDIEQGEELQKSHFIPNRVFFFNLPYESIMERLSQRRIDPVTGERLALMSDV